LRKYILYIYFISVVKWREYTDSGLHGVIAMQRAEGAQAKLAHAPVTHHSSSPKRGKSMYVYCLFLWMIWPVLFKMWNQVLIQNVEAKSVL